MKTSTRIKTIGGVEFEALRISNPAPHWRVKVVKTGYVFEAGVFPSTKSLDYLWQYVEDAARRRGDLWAWDCGVGSRPVRVYEFAYDQIGHDGCAERCHVRVSAETSNDAFRNLTIPRSSIRGWKVVNTESQAA